MLLVDWLCRIRCFRSRCLVGRRDCSSAVVIVGFVMQRRREKACWLQMRMVGQRLYLLFAAVTVVANSVKLLRTGTVWRQMQTSDQTSNRLFAHHQMLMVARAVMVGRMVSKSALAGQMLLVE